MRVIRYSIEFTQPTSYFIWKNESKSSIIQEVQEIGLIRFFQDQIRTKVAMAADLYTWLSKNKKKEAGFSEIQPSLTVFLESMGFLFFLFFFGAFSDFSLVFQQTISNLNNSHNFTFDDQSLTTFFKIFFTSASMFVSFGLWMFSDVFPGIIIGNSIINHPVGTIFSMIVSFLYHVEPSILMSASYFF